MNALYSLYDALISINVPGDRARAVVDAMEHEMSTQLATKSDLTTTQLLLKQDINGVRDSLKQEIGGVRDSLKQEIGALREVFQLKLDQLGNSLVLRLGAISAAGFILMFSALKVFA
jgi:hypothetical protein